MNAMERKILNDFRPKLLIAFFKMIKGINVELSEDGKNEIKKTDSGRWWFISSINEDESVNIVSQTHTIWENIPLKYLKL